MHLLISFYDNFLIYYSNIFFFVVFAILIALVISIIKVMRAILREGSKSFRKVRLQPIKISNFPLVLLLRFIGCSRTFLKLFEPSLKIALITLIIEITSAIRIANTTKKKIFE